MTKQIQTTLPRSEWDKVIILEDGTGLLTIESRGRLQTHILPKQYQPSYIVRMTVAERLQRASMLLPHNVKLVLIEGYRTLAHQESDRNYLFEKIKNFPSSKDLNPDQVWRKVDMLVARPTPFANHFSGAAVDVTLCDKNGPLDMGTPYIMDVSEEDMEKITMFSTFITHEQAANRKLLREAMEAVGFVWYPGEWWHYCYGDRMWAVYTNREKCFYGPVDVLE